MTMRIDLILPQFVLLDVMYVLAACMQTIHVPLVVSRRMSYNRVAACLYEASLVVHLAIVADILLCSTGNRLLAPPFAIAHALTGILWLNLLLVAFGIGLAAYYRRPCMIPELALIAASIPPVGLVPSSSKGRFSSSALFRRFFWMRAIGKRTSLHSRRSRLSM